MNATFEAWEVGGAFLGMRIEADLREASAAIHMNGEATPFQTADVRHSSSEMAETLNDWARSEGGEYWEKGTPIEVWER